MRFVAFIVVVPHPLVQRLARRRRQSAARSEAVVRLSRGVAWRVARTSQNMCVAFSAVRVTCVCKLALLLSRADTVKRLSTRVGSFAMLTSHVQCTSPPQVPVSHTVRCHPNTRCGVERSLGTCCTPLQTFTEPLHFGWILSVVIFILFCTNALIHLTRFSRLLASSCRRRRPADPPRHHRVVRAAVDDHRRRLRADAVAAGVAIDDSECDCRWQSGTNNARSLLLLCVSSLSLSPHALCPSHTPNST